MKKLKLMKKTLDIEKYKIPYDTAIENITHIHNTYGKYFNLKYKKITYPCILEIKTNINNDTKYFELRYDIGVERYELHPFLIWFIDYYEMKRDNYVHIHNVQKIDKLFTGNNIMTFLMYLLKKIKVEKITLEDDSTVLCQNEEVRLPPIKFLEKKSSFYEKYNFVKTQHHMSTFFKFKTTKDYNKALNDIIDRIQRIKINHLIKKLHSLLDFITDSVKKQIDIVAFGVKSPSNIYPQVNWIMPEIRVTNMFNTVINILKILQYSNDIYLYKYLIKLFKDRDNCDYYIILYEDLLQLKIHTLSTGKDKITLNFVKLFRYYLQLIHNIVYEFIIKKQ